MKRMQPLVLAICTGLVLCFATSAVASAEEPTKKSAEPTKKKSYKDKLFDDADTYDVTGKQVKKVEVVQLYPLATRIAPSQEGAAAMAKLRNQMVTALQANKYDAANEAAVKLAADPKANIHDQAEAVFVQKKVVTEKDKNNHKDTIPLLEKAIELNGLDNNIHYSLLAELAQRYLINQDYQDALETSEKFLSETKVEKKEIIAVKGNALYRLKRLPEAIVTLEKLHSMDAADVAVTQMLAKAYSENKQSAKAAELAKSIVQTTGNDRVSQINLAITFFEAKQLIEAGDVIDGLRTNKQLNDEHDYKTAMMVYSGMKKREADLASVVQEGLDKGALKASASNYNILAEAYYYSDENDRLDRAIAAWNKAAPLAKDGTVYLNLAIVQCQEERWVACKESAKNAIAKGGINANDAKAQIAEADKRLSKSK